MLGFPSGIVSASVLVEPGLREGFLVPYIHSPDLEGDNPICFCFPASFCFHLNPRSVIIARATSRFGRRKTCPPPKRSKVVSSICWLRSPANNKKVPHDGVIQAPAPREVEMEATRTQLPLQWVVVGNCQVLSPRLEWFLHMPAIASDHTYTVRPKIATTVSTKHSLRLVKDHIQSDSRI